jgi:hypothetical protein
MTHPVRRWVLVPVAAAAVLAGVFLFLGRPGEEKEPTSAIATEEPADGDLTRDIPPDVPPPPAATDPPPATADDEISIVSHVLRPGDSLSSIADTFYGPPDRQRGAHWLVIYDYNAEADIIDPVRTPIVATPPDGYTVLLEVGGEILIPFYPGDYPDRISILEKYPIVDGAAPSPADGLVRDPSARTVASAWERVPRWATLSDPGLTAPRPTTARPPQETYVPPAVARRRGLPESPPAVTPDPTPGVPPDPGLPVEPAPPARRTFRLPGLESIIVRLRDQPPEPAPPPETVPIPQLEPPSPTRVSPDLPRPALPRATLALPERSEEAVPVPAITLKAPVHGTFYGPTVTVEGVVQASAGVDIGRDQRTVRRLSAYFEGRDDDTEAAEEISWDTTSGSFRAVLDTSGLQGRQSLVVEGENDRGEVVRRRVTLFDGNTPPSVTLTAPDRAYGYGEVLEIAGFVRDETADFGQPRGVETLRYHLEPVDFAVFQNPVEGEVKPEGDGSFSILVPGNRLTGAQLVTLTIRSVSGAELREVFEIEPAVTAIPRITATGGDGSATLDWSVLPGERSYRIYYRPVGSREGLTPPEELRLWNDPSVRTVADAAPPYTVTGLENTTAYYFQVVTGETGREAWSAVAASVPLDGTEVKVSVANDFDAILLDWNTLPEVSRYALWRRAETEEGYTRIVSVEGGRYRDERVRYGLRYFYRVSPDLAGTTRSAIATGMTTAVPQDVISRVAMTSLPSGSAVGALTVSGDYVVVANPQGVSLLDIWDAPNIIRRGEVKGIQSVSALTAWDRYVIAADGEGRLRVIDTDNAARPGVVFSGPAAGAVDVVAVPASTRILVFAAYGSGGLAVHELRHDPADLPVLSRVGGTSSVAVAAAVDPTDRDSILLASSGGDDVSLYRVDPAGRMVRRSSLGLENVTDLDLLIEADGRSLVLAATTDELVVIDPEGPSVLSRTPFSGGAAVRGVAYDDGAAFAYLGSTSRGVAVFDLSDPTGPVQFAVTEEQHAVTALSLHTDLAGETTVVAATSGGPLFYRAHTLGRSRTVATVEIPGSANRVGMVSALWGPMLLISDSRGVALYPVDQASALRERNAQPQRYIQVGSDVMGADIVVTDTGAYLLVADRREGLFVFDLADTATPVAHLSADLRLLDVSGSYRDGRFLACVVDQRWGLIVVDLTNLDEPVQRSATPTPDPRAIAVIEHHVFLADARDGVVVIDIANPDLPRRDYTVDLPGSRAIHVERSEDGRIAAAVVTAEGVVILTAGAAAGFTVRGTYPTSFAENVWIQNGAVAVPEGILGLTILDLKNPDRPRRISTSDLEYAVDAVLTGSYAFATDGDDLYVLEVLIPPWLAGTTSTP